MLRSALAAVVLLAVLIMSGVPAETHSLARGAPLASHPAAEFVTTLHSETHDGLPCHDGQHGPLCCLTGLCSMVGYLLTNEQTFSPVLQGQPIYSIFIGSQPDGSGVTPDLPPPRAIV